LILFLKKTYFYIGLIILSLILLSGKLFSQDSNIVKTAISNISFSGNDYFSSPELLNMIVSKPGGEFVKEQFDLDLKNIISNYQSEGYLNCSITNVSEKYNFDSSGVSLSVVIDEGKQIVIGEIIFEGNKIFSTRYLTGLMYTKVGEVLGAGTLNNDVEQILNKYEDKGYSFAVVKVKDISTYTDKGKEKLRVTISIEENERIKIDDVVIEGNTTTKKNVIMRELRLGDEKYVTKENILDIQKRLENTGYFESVEQPKILKYKTSTVLDIKVKEGNTNTFDGILGYVPPTQTESSGYFTGLVNLSLRNLFGTGRRADARWQKETRSTQELELKYLEPWVLGYPFNANIGFLQRIQDSTYIKRNVSFKGEALITKSFSASVLANFERVIPTLNDNNIQIYNVFDSRTISTGVEIKLDTRDYVYNPASGVLYRTSYQVGQKKIYNASAFPNLDLPGDFTVQKGTVDLDFYYSFFRRQTSLVGVHGVEIRSPEFEIADYMRFGGSTTVRGYREDQFLASRAAWANFELRYSLTRKTFASIFYDAGYYKKPYDALTMSPEQSGFIFGYGAGIRIETALGIFGISYALGKGDTFLEGKIHFGLINDF
jgi:outer membrane protein insertion porin family